MISWLRLKPPRLSDNALSENLPGPSSVPASDENNAPKPIAAAAAPLMAITYERTVRNLSHSDDTARPNVTRDAAVCFHVGSSVSEVLISGALISGAVAMVMAVSFRGEVIVDVVRVWSIVSLIRLRRSVRGSCTRRRLPSDP